MSLFTDLATAVIDGLEPDERAKVDSQVFARIISLCTDHIEARDRPQRAPDGPATNQIRARFLAPGDYLLRAGGRFEEVLDVIFTAGGVQVALHPQAHGDMVLWLNPSEVVQIARDRSVAAQWALSRQEVP